MGVTSSGQSLPACTVSPSAINKRSYWYIKLSEFRSNVSKLLLTHRVCFEDCVGK